MTLQKLKEEAMKEFEKYPKIDQIRIAKESYRYALFEFNDKFLDLKIEILKIIIAKIKINFFKNKIIEYLDQKKENNRIKADPTILFKQFNQITTMTPQKLKEEARERSYKLDMGYDSMWSLIEDLSSEELKEEAERLSNEIFLMNKEQNQIQQNKEMKARKLTVLNEILKRRENAILAKTEPTEEHRKLLKRMYFKKLENGGDYVFIGCSGKRPFGNSNIYNNIAEILKWKLQNNDLSDEQIERANKLLRELPFVINNIFKKL